MTQKILLLAAAGALGTLARYWLCAAVGRFNGTAFPWGTVAVNLAGCFLAGLVWSLFEHRFHVSGHARTAVMVGFLGGFTTFSAFMLDTWQLADGAKWAPAAANLALQNVLGLCALLAGIALGRPA